MDPAQPICSAVSASVSGRSSTPPIDPTIVTSRPSSTQAMPSASTTRQCQRDQGSRSRRAGMSLVVRIARTISARGRIQTPR
jgi:hypothetical protein